MLKKTRKPVKGMLGGQTTLYDKIGVRYDDSRRADRFLTARLRHYLEPVENEIYLDVGCGTGNYTRALAGAEFEFCGVDPSRVMLTKAACSGGAKRVRWINGAAERLPFADEVFGGAVATLTIHHWRNLRRAFAEVFRVLKPGGRFVLFTSFPEQMEGYWLNRYFPVMLRASIAQMPAGQPVCEALEAAGFAFATIENYDVRRDLQDHFLYCGKERPELYLREDVRRGISSFSNLARCTEIAEGLRRLAADIETGAIAEVINGFRHERGDYAFVAAGKV